MVQVLNLTNLALILACSESSNFRTTFSIKIEYGIRRLVQKSSVAAVQRRIPSAPSLDLNSGADLLYVATMCSRVRTSKSSLNTPGTTLDLFTLLISGTFKMSSSFVSSALWTP